MNMISSVEGSVEPKPAGVMPARWVVGTFAGWTVGFVLSILFIVGVESMGLRETQFRSRSGWALPWVTSSRASSRRFCRIAGAGSGLQPSGSPRLLSSWTSCARSSCRSLIRFPCWSRLVACP